MFRLVTCCALLFLGLCGKRVAADDPGFVVAGYLPDYRLSGWSKETGPVTDVIFFGMSAPANGVFDPLAIAEENITAVREVKEKSNCRILFTVGGWERSEGFAALAGDERLRTEFIREAAAFCLQSGIDGIDYDWEHPDGDGEIRSFGALLADTHSEFARHDLLVTIAQAGWQNFGTKAYQSVDRVHLMAYDHDFPQATFEKAQLDVERLQKAGCPASKIVLGVPFYGRNKDGDAIAYAQLSTNPAFGPDVSILNGYAFNGPTLVARKVRFAKAEGLAGVMIWELGQDARGASSLLNALDDTLQH
ncbi:MAG: glycoside hydrolase family 18 protein [Planctomycetaceae bacterium]|nr:glycoside hydrolase family 18 protein [Planctomycetaceae bacterium]